MAGVRDRIRELRARMHARAHETEAGRRRNLFEAAAAYVVGCAEDDQERIDEASTWVDPGALTFGINELAVRAVIALARERDESPETVARGLLGLPPA